MSHHHACYDGNDLQDLWDELARDTGKDDTRDTHDTGHDNH